MRRRRASVASGLLVMVGLGTPHPARADEPIVVVVPPVITSAPELPVRPSELEALLLAELRRGPEFDQVRSITAPIPQWTVECLDDVRCLEELAIVGGAPRLVAAAVVRSPDGPALAGVYVERGRIQARVTVPLQRDVEERVYLAVESLLTGIPIPDALLWPERFEAAEPAEPPRTPPEPAPRPPEPESAPPVADARPPKPERPARTRTRPSKADEPARTAKARPPVPDRPERVGFRLAMRGGWARYDKFDFGAGEIELARRLVGPSFLVVGASVYAVTRDLPPDLETANGGDTVFDAMIPLHAGLQFQRLRGTLRPYVGADFVTAQYLADDEGRYWTQGVRGRLGVDAMFGQSGVAWTVHAGIGAWTDDGWPRVEPDIATFGPVLHAGTGLVLIR